MKWFKNGILLDRLSTGKYTMIQQNGFVRLSIENPIETDSAEYKCEIALPGEPVQFISHNLIVKPIIAAPVPEERQKRHQKRAGAQEFSIRESHVAPVALSSFMKNLTIEEGNSAKFVCSVIGQVQTVEWFKDNVPLQPELDHRLRFINSDVLVGLEIHDIILSDSGFYTCTINGRRNSVTSSSKLTVYEAYKPRKKSFTKNRPSMPSSLNEFIGKGNISYIHDEKKGAIDFTFLYTKYFFPIKYVHSFLMFLRFGSFI